MDPSKSENARLALAGKLFHAFVPELTAARSRCKQACNRYNTAGELNRRSQVELWRDIVQDARSFPPLLPNEDLDAAQFEDDPWVESPIRVDYGTNLRLGNNVYINFNCTILDSSLVTIGSRTLLASNVSLYSATHPLDPTIRNGTKGPELGKDIRIGSDCFIGGSVTICPGVTIGNGSTVGAGSVVTKDVPEMCVVAGNPARILRRLDGIPKENGFQKNGLPNQGHVTPTDVIGKSGKAKLETDGKDGHHDKSSISSNRSDAEKADVQIDTSLMTKEEWEDEMGRQIAERALVYGSSLK